MQRFLELLGRMMYPQSQEEAVKKVLAPGLVSFFVHIAGFPFFNRDVLKFWLPWVWKSSGEKFGGNEEHSFEPEWVEQTERSH